MEVRKRYGWMKINYTNGMDGWKIITQRDKNETDGVFWEGEELLK